MRYESGVVRRLLWTLSRLACINARRAPLVLTTSDYCRRVINQHYGVPIRRIRIVPEGIDLAGWQGALVRSTYERESLTILCVARQYPRKRIADLLLAFQQVHRQIPSARPLEKIRRERHAAIAHPGRNKRSSDKRQERSATGVVSTKNSPYREWIKSRKARLFRLKSKWVFT